MKYGEGNTIAMVYDNVPIIDYFHYVSDDMVAGVMDAKTDASDSPFYFYLKRVPSGNLSTKL